MDASALPTIIEGASQTHPVADAVVEEASVVSGHEHHNKVELATLSLPASASGVGLEAGEGAHLILEASNETVEQMQKAAAAAASDSDGPSTLISAVVDLEKLSELIVGVSEAELITGLHHDMHEQRGGDDDDNDEDVEDDYKSTASSLFGLGSLGAKTTASSHKAAADEETPLIASFNNNDTASTAEEDTPSTTDQISLSADPFLESLAEVLPTTLPTLDENAVFDNNNTVDCAFTIHTEAAATTTEDDHQHFAHDAFLLNVPQTDAEGNQEAHFVLALPEITVSPSIQTDTSALSEGSHAGFLGLHLERAMSLLPPTTLPTDVQNVHLEATEHTPTKADPTEVHLDIVVERQVPVIGYVILFSGLFALASVGAALDLQQGGVTPIMKTLWRQIATSLALLPLVVQSLRDVGMPQLSVSEVALLMISAAAYAYMTLAFVVSLDMTTMANAFVLSNMTSLVIIAARAALGLPVAASEGAGAITGFIGAAICAQDAAKTVSASVSAETSGNLGFLGNLVAFSASFGTAGYLLIAKKLRPKMDLFVFMFTVMSLGSVFLVILLLSLETEEISFDLHPAHGILGWVNLQADRLPLELYMAVVCNCLGTTGYIAVMKYFDPIVPATVMLLEPVIGAFLGTLAGTAPLPGLQTWFGDLIVACGTFLVIKAGAKTTESIDATEALRPRIENSDDLKSVTTHSTKGTRIIVPDSSGGRGDDDSSAKVVWGTAS